MAIAAITLAPARGRRSGHRWHRGRCPARPPFLHGRESGMCHVVLAGSRPTSGAAHCLACAARATSARLRCSCRGGASPERRNSAQHLLVNPDRLLHRLLVGLGPRDSPSHGWQAARTRFHRRHDRLREQSAQRIAAHASLRRSSAAQGADRGRCGDTVARAVQWAEAPTPETPTETRSRLRPLPDVFDAASPTGYSCRKPIKHCPCSGVPAATTRVAANRSRVWTPSAPGAGARAARARPRRHGVTPFADTQPYTKSLDESESSAADRSGPRRLSRLLIFP